MFIWISGDEGVGVDEEADSAGSAIVNVWSKDGFETNVCRSMHVIRHGLHYPVTGV